MIREAPCRAFKTLIVLFPRTWMDELDHQPQTSSSSQLFLCFSVLFLLSWITLVVAGAIPVFLARRRASLPASNTRFFFFILPTSGNISSRPFIWF